MRFPNKRSWPRNCHEIAAANHLLSGQSSHIGRELSVGLACYHTRNHRCWRDLAGIGLIAGAVVVTKYNN